MAENDSIPLVPLIPLMPSHPIEVSGKSLQYICLSLSLCSGLFFKCFLVTNIFSYSCLQNVENETTVQPETAATTEVPVILTTTITGPTGSSEQEEEQDRVCLSVSRSRQSREAIGAAIQKLGVQLLQNLETTPEQPNVIISPLSISLALSQLALGMHVLL